MAIGFYLLMEIRPYEQLLLATHQALRLTIFFVLLGGAIIVTLAPRWALDHYLFGIGIPTAISVALVGVLAMFALAEPIPRSGRLAVSMTVAA